MLLSRFPFGLIRQSWTKSYSTVSALEVEALKKLTFDSVHARNNISPSGFPLSAARLNVNKGPSIEFAKLAPFLFEFLDTVTTNDRRYDGPKWEAFEVLENALQVLTSEESKSGLTSKLVNTLQGLLHNKMKSNTEETVNVAIVNHVLQHLTRSCFVLNKRHSKVLEPGERMCLPEAFHWDGLALGHRSAWYGELDMLICPLITGEAEVALLGEKCHVDSLFEDEEGSDVEEGFSLSRPPHGSTAFEGKEDIGKNWSIFGGHFSQGFATAVTFSYVYHYMLSVDTNSADASFLPTVQVSPRGCQVFIYDCLQDVMFANNFFWSRPTLIYLWAILHHRLFLPAQLDSNLANCVPKFGYNNNGSPLFENRHELLFGENIRSQYFLRAEPEDGRMDWTEKYSRTPRTIRG